MEKTSKCSNIKQIYNVHVVNKNEIRGPRVEIQQLLNLLNNDHYISRYKVCDDGVTTQDIF